MITIHIAVQVVTHDAHEAEIDGESLVFSLMFEATSDSGLAAAKLYREMMKKLSDARDASKNTQAILTCTLTFENATVISEFLPLFTEYKFSDEFSKLQFTKALLDGKSRLKVAEDYAKWQTQRLIPDDPIESNANPNLALRPHQRCGAVLSRRGSGNYALLFEQGCGKTPTSVARMCSDAVDLRNSGETRMLRVLIVCPKQVRLNWQAEIHRFATVPGMANVFRADAIKRMGMLLKAMVPVNGEYFTAIITSYGLLVESWDTVLKFIEWDLVIADESHNFKDGGTLRAKMMLRVPARSKHRMILTGTPIANSALDLYTQLEFLERGLSGFRSNTAFKKHFGITARNKDGTQPKLVDVQNIPELKTKLAQVAFFVYKHEVYKDLPPKQYNIYEVEMTKRQADDYKAMATQLCLEIKTELDNAETEQSRAMVVNHVIVKMMKLAQITSGFLIMNEERDETGEVIHGREVIRYPQNPKLLAVNEFIDNMKPDEKMIIWTCWREDIFMIDEMLTAKGTRHVKYYGDTSDNDRNEAVRLYNDDPTMQVFLANLDAANSGLNLLGYDWWNGPNAKHTTNTTDMVYFAQAWKPIPRWQSEDRPHRDGTRVPVRYWDLVVPQTIDEEIRVAVCEKRKQALSIADLKEMLEKILEGVGK